MKWSSLAAPTILSAPEPPFWLLLAESHRIRGVFGRMVRRIEALPLPVG